MSAAAMHERLAPAHRKLYDLPDVPSTSVLPPTSIAAGGGAVSANSGSSEEELCRMIRDGLIGEGTPFRGPFGTQRILYCDYTASGRSLDFIEDYISKHVIPFYGNTHTTTSVTALQTTLFRHEARELVQRGVNAGEKDIVLFVGTGVTGAVHKFIHAVGIMKHVTEGRTVTVFVGPYEHHSNLLPWREAGARVINIAEDADGNIDIAMLEEELKTHEGTSSLMIGAFSAASNVTGVLSDCDALSIVLHKYGALATFDYATAGPYVPVNMNPLMSSNDEDSSLNYKDAIFISPHKFVGGVGSPGVLVAKRELFLNDVPLSGGGGSVFFVTDTDHRYLQDIELREEGGTPDIVGSIRAGLAFQLKAAVGAEAIEQREHALWKRARDSLAHVPDVVLLGPTSESSAVRRLPILSFMIRHQPSGRFLHYNFIVAVLNDLFGIQARGGCACAGPYGQALLGIDSTAAKRFESLLVEDERLDRRHLRRQYESSSHELLRPGFVRLNIPWFMSEEAVSFVLEAITLISRYAWRLLPNYQMNTETGEWKHYGFTVLKDRKWLGGIRYKKGRMTYALNSEADAALEITGASRVDYGAVLANAQRVFNHGLKSLNGGTVSTLLNSDVENMRWFVYPSEAIDTGSDISLKESQGAEISIQPKTYAIGYESTSNILSSVTESVIDQAEDLEKTTMITDETKSKKKGKCQPQLPPEVKLLRQYRRDAARNNGWITPHRKDIMKPFMEAIFDFDMIRPGDRVIVCISGGKDSLTLLHALHNFQNYAKHAMKLDFDLAAATVDPMTPSFNPRPLIPYMKQLGIEYFYLSEGIISIAESLPDGVRSICSFCSRIKRGVLYSCARREGYNVLAMGQHLDDLAESMTMSFFHNGFLRTMKANYTVAEGDLRVIRPLVYVREKATRSFAETAGLPVIMENCPACFEAPTERQRTKQMLAAQELLFPDLYASLKSAMLPYMSINGVGMEARSGHSIRPGAPTIGADDADDDEPCSRTGDFNVDRDEASLPEKNSNSSSSRKIPLPPANIKSRSGKRREANENLAPIVSSGKRPERPYAHPNI